MTDAKRLSCSLAVSAALSCVLLFAGSVAALAQARDVPAGNGDTMPGGNGKKPPGRGGGIGVKGLPDAVTVIEILKHLPKNPGGGGGRSSSGDDPPAKGQPSSKSHPRSKSALNTPRPPAKPPANSPPSPKSSPPQNAPTIVGTAGPDALDREVLVSLRKGATAAAVAALSQALDIEGQTVYTSTLLGARLVRFRIPGNRTVDAVLNQLAQDARVEIVEPHYVYAASGAAAALPMPQYAPQKLNLEAAHKIASGKKIKIAVIDTAVDVAHPAFSGARIETFDALGGDDTSAAELHGTAIASIAGARDGLEGVAPQAALLSVRAFTSEKGAAPKSYTLALLKGLDFAAVNGARVVNMSFAGPEDPILAKAIEAADAKGMVLVAAAGNGGPEAKAAYPAAYANVIAVTATGNDDKLYSSANRGSYIAIAAPGVDIIAAAPGGAYDISSGTSLAAAHVSGIAALMLEKNPKATPKDVREALMQSAHKLPGSRIEETGAGIADAAAALKTGK